MENVEIKRLIEIKPTGRAVFVGDTHGDVDASRKVINKYLKKDTKIVFLGDYVDRGDASRENTNYLLKMKEKYPKQIYLLLGNHDAYSIVQCSPTDFWDSLSNMEKENYFGIFKKFPLVVSIGKIIALHGALPDIKKLTDINKIRDKDENWMQIIWGDFQEIKGKDLGIDFFTGRPQFGKDYFTTIMKRFGKNVLIRSHQPNAPERMFDNRCLTIFTSNAYARKRTIAIVDMQKEIKTIDNIIIKEI